MTSVGGAARLAGAINTSIDIHYRKLSGKRFKVMGPRKVNRFDDFDDENSLEKLEQEYNEDRESVFEKFSSSDYDFYDEDNGYDGYGDNNYAY